MNIQRKNSAHHFRMQSEREQTLVKMRGHRNKMDITWLSARILDAEIYQIF